MGAEGWGGRVSGLWEGKCRISPGQESSCGPAVNAGLYSTVLSSCTSACIQAKGQGVARVMQASFATPTEAQRKAHPEMHKDCKATLPKAA